jgi:hypothetical protein
MISQHWTKDDTGRLSATWVEVSAANRQPTSPLLPAAEPTRDHPHSSATGRLQGGSLMTCLVAAFIGWLARETPLL